MQKFVIILVLALLALSTTAMAQTDNHTVTVTIPAINEVAITGGDFELIFVVPAPGDDPADVSDGTTCDLDWSTNTASQKITVVSNIASPVATLTVTAGAVSGGTTTGAVTLNTTAGDFVTGVSLGTGGCDLEYSASCVASDAAGSEVHTVTYTITAS